MHLTYLPSSIRSAAFAILLTIAVSPLVRGQVFTEIGDAGQTPATAQNTGLSQSVGQVATIFGTILGPNDADIFRITIINVGAFAASVVNTVSPLPGGLDTQLFLFDSAFRPVVANDDASGATLRSTIPAGTFFLSSLAPGTYYLAISLSGNDPVNSSNQLLFASSGGDTTAVRGMASGLAPNTLFNFDGQNTFADAGSYQINIINIPETGSTLLLAVVMFGALVGLRRFWLVRATVRK